MNEENTAAAIEALNNLLNFFEEDNANLTDTLSRQKETFGHEEGNFYILD